MRGQSEKQASLEELCRAGDRPRRVCPFPFRECGEDFAAPAASDFLDGQKVTKEPLGTRPMDYGSAVLRLGP